MRRFVLLRGAKTDLRGAYRYYKAEKEGLGEEFLRDFYTTRSWIIEYPLASPVVYKNFRKARFPIFKFHLVYSVEPEEIVVIAVMHWRRNPNYWKTRIKAK